MTKDEQIDEIAMLIDLGKMLGEDTHTIAETIYEGTSRRRMKMNKVQKYVKERDEMLLKRNPEELRKFVQSHSEYFHPRYVLAIAAAPKQILEITLHKMIFNAKNLPKR